MTLLHDPEAHRPLAGAVWDDAAARAAIAEIAADAVEAYRGADELWPQHPLDLEPEEVWTPRRAVYHGAAGMAWGLHRLAEADLCPALPGLGELVATLPEAYRAAPDVDSDDPEQGAIDSLLLGETGLLLVAEAVAPDARRRDQLAACVERMAQSPARELCYGSAGTMAAALALWRATGEERWRSLWAESAAWLAGEWHETVWVQDLFGREWRHVGAGHGFAGNAWALLAGADLITPPSGGHETGHIGRSDAPHLAERVAATLRELAVVDGDVAQWPVVTDRKTERKPVQWCHGAPGIVISLAPVLPADPETDALLIKGGELTWRAGPLTKGVGLCHGTAGNAYALLALHARTGDELWLQRARAFAMDAVADVAQRRTQNDGRGRHSLFTGDLGVALLLRSCLTGDTRFPFLEDALANAA